MINQPLVEGKDYYLTEDGRFVFTAEFLLNRGYCCGNGCRHCPYPKDDLSPNSGKGNTSQTTDKPSANRQAWWLVD